MEARKGLLSERVKSRRKIDRQRNRERETLGTKVTEDTDGERE